MIGDQAAVGGMRGDAQRARVRNRHRNRAEPDAAAHPQLLGEQPHRRGELLPPQIRFQTGQEQERRARGVAQRPQVQLRFGIVGEVIGLERHQRTARTVVQQLVDIERGDKFALQALAQVRGRQAHGVPGVGEALQSVHQDRARAVGGRQLRSGELQFVHSRLVVHRVLLPARSTTSGYPGRPASSGRRGGEPMSIVPHDGAGHRTRWGHRPIRRANVTAGVDIPGGASVRVNTGNRRPRAIPRSAPVGVAPRARQAGTAQWAV
ncbi:Uncharacterised protein [Mycobacteroides abscessus subsp. abscessus]|nr:Uncharacterised protein [Mycobacteroides abscessus subsp. abscessus]